MPLSETRKRPHSEVMEIYAGPEDFMEAGARGFLITTISEREEPAIDQAMKMLRKACVKLFGGMKPQVKSTTALFSNGYIAVDFMDPESVTVLPNPELKPGKTTNDQEEVKEEEEDSKEKSEKNEGDPENAQTDEKGAADEGEDKENGQAEEEDVKKEVEMEKEDGDAEEKDEEMEVDKSVDKSAEAEEDAPDKNTSNVKEKSKEDGEEKKKKEDDDDGKTSKAKESPEKRGSDGGKSKTDSQKSKSNREEERRRREKRKREVDTTPKWPLMKAPYKFKAFRTELRNIMFIKSNIPDPLVLVKEMMDLILNQQPLKADSINQLLPIQGICNYSYWELEVMSRRVLAPFFQEDLEEPPSFGILMFDKLCEPGADILAEIVRSAIWSINPMAWQSAPLSETDVVIHLELIGSKIVLSAMTHYMKYRQYSPFCVAEMGEGKPEDPEEQERRRVERERSDRKGRSRSRSDRPQKSEDTPSSKGKEKEKEKEKADSSHEKEDAKKDGKEKTEESVKEEKKGEDEEKSQEEAKDPAKKEEAAESGEKEWRKTRRGKRGGVRKKN